jgi:glutaredoxin
VHALHAVIMKVQLLVSEWCMPCRDAEQVWRRMAQQKAFAFEVLDVTQLEGRAVVAELGVRTVPSTVIDGTLKHLGVPTLKEAADFVAAAPDRVAGAAQYVGLTLEATSAWAIVAGALYLALAGGAFLVPEWRLPALHIFGLGFAVFLVFGLAEHLLPRFTGAPIRGGAIAWLQQALAHAGVLLLAAGFAIAMRPLALAGGLLAWTAFALCAARLVPVLLAPQPPSSSSS